MNEQNQKKILIVDDDLTILELYVDVLTSAGFLVDSVSNGQSALEILKKKEHSLVLLDIMMPDMDGIMVLKSIRAEASIYEHPLIVMLTNLALTDNIKEALDSGAEGYLIKLSLSNEQLIQQVKNYLFGFQK